MHTLFILDYDDIKTDKERNDCYYTVSIFIVSLLLFNQGIFVSMSLRMVM